MNIKSRGSAIAASLLIFLVLAPVGVTAQAQGQSLKDQLVGHWQLVSVNFNGNSPYGANPQGSMFLDAAGHYAVIVITGGQARNVSYFGTYTVNDADSSMTMHIDASSGANAAGQDQRRLVTFSGDEMVQQNLRSNGTKGGLTLTWKRAN